MAWLWKVLPFVGKLIHRLEVARRDERITELEKQVEYWRGRCELLTDQALARAGAISMPTMRDAKPHDAQSAAALLTKALGTTEIESKRKG